MGRELLWCPGQGDTRDRDGWSLTNHPGLQIHKHSPGHMLPSPGFTKEVVEGVVPSTDGLVAGHLSIWLDPVFQAVELPARIANLHTGLPHMD